MIVKLEAVSEPTALNPVIAPVEVLKDAPAGSEPADTEYVKVTSDSETSPVNVTPPLKVPLLPESKIA